jgi:hypothetical protein
MEKGLLFLTLFMLCLWVILDDFFGTKKLTLISLSLTPNIGTSYSEAMEEAGKRLAEQEGTLTDKMDERYKGVDTPV